MSGTVYAGTSGFAYPAWKPGFYPQDLPQKRFLQHYSSRLNAVEINYTFRRLVAAATLEKWVAETRDGFLFSPKAHMRITHSLKLRNAEEFTGMFLRSIDPLRTARRLGPVLFQLAPTFKCDAGLLDSYLAGLPKDVRVAFEFRHESWLGAETYRVLEKHGAALCVAESEKLEVPHVFTAGFAYFRLRKPEYSAEDIERFRRIAAEITAQSRDVFMFFKHEETPDGALYAASLLNGGSSSPGAV